MPAITTAAPLTRGKPLHTHNVCNKEDFDVLFTCYHKLTFDVLSVRVSLVHSLARAAIADQLLLAIVQVHAIASARLLRSHAIGDITASALALPNPLAFASLVHPAARKARVTGTACEHVQQ